MAYQGHMADGSSVQKHSAGSHYPYVVGKREGNPIYPWFVICPGGQELGFSKGEAAFEWAEIVAKVRRECSPAKRAELRAAGVYV